MKSKGIIFSAEMVKAILEGRKTQTRRVIKPQPTSNMVWVGRLTDTTCRENRKNIGKLMWSDKKEHLFAKDYCLLGDILWVRETWSYAGTDDQNNPMFYYKADDEMPSGLYLESWHPSIHMPKEAARIFLKVKDVKVERLNDITEKDAVKEGFTNTFGFIHSSDNVYDPPPTTARCKFIADFCRIYVKDELDTYNNPWVWVIEFERTEEK